MTPERWAQVEELFHRAAESDPQHRTALLDQVCSHDAELREQVEALLSSDKSARGKVNSAVRSELDAVAFSLVGKTISHYRILEGLGGGGMGLVYCAEDIKLSRRLAIKFLPEESAKDPHALARFEREARAASELEHPNICPIYEFGEHEGQPFIVMPLLKGQTVEHFIHAEASAKRPVQVLRLLDLATQVLRGLEAAHGHGIIHRDIKPGNIFLTSDGHAKILDFGVAKLLHAEIDVDRDHHAHGEADTATVTRSADLVLSRTGMLVGTAAYMSPEQVRGENLDARTDLFSFGLVLYELATGKRAFTGDTWPALQEAILRQVPDPARGVNPRIPAKLEAVIKKALEKNREARYQSASEMLADLDDLQRQLAPKHLPRAWALGLGVACTIFIGTMVFVLKRQPKTVSVAPEIKLRQLTTNSSENPVIGGAISPDGKYLAYSDVKGMHIKLIETGETRSIPQPEALKDQNVKWEVGAWFLDSTRFLAHAHASEEEWNQWSSQDASIWVTSVVGGAPRKLRDHAVASSPSPDGSSIFFGTNKGSFGEREIWVMDSNGEQARKLFETKEGTMCCLGLSPDEKRYLYISDDTMLSRDVKGGPSTALLLPAEMKKMNDIVWLPEGRLVYSLPESDVIGSACNYWTMRLDMRTGKRIEQPRRLTNWSGFCVFGGTATADGKRLTFMESTPGHGTVYVADLKDGGTRIANPRHFTLEEIDTFVSDWTLDSKTALVSQNYGDHYGLYKQTLDSDSMEPIVPKVPGGIIAESALSPDGKWIIGLIWPVPGAPSPANPSAPLPLVRIPITGGSPEPVLHVVRAGLFSCARPPSKLCVISELTEDRRHMVVTAFDPVKGRGPELARFELDRELDLSVNVLICDISPDGTRLAVARGPDGPIEIRSLRGPSSQVIRAKGLDKLFNIRWAADGKGLFVAKRVKNATELLHLNLQGETKSLWKSNGPIGFGAPSPDGRHLAIYDWKQSTNMWMMENF